MFLEALKLRLSDLFLSFAFSLSHTHLRFLTHSGPCRPPHLLEALRVSRGPWDNLIPAVEIDSVAGRWASYCAPLLPLCLLSFLLPQYPPISSSSHPPPPPPLPPSAPVSDQAPEYTVSCSINSGIFIFWELPLTLIGFLKVGDYSSLYRPRRHII